MYPNVTGLLCSQGNERALRQIRNSKLETLNQDEWSPVKDYPPPGEEASPHSLMMSIHTCLLSCKPSKLSAFYQIGKGKCLLACRNLPIPVRSPLHRVSSFVRTGSVWSGWWELGCLAPCWWRASSELNVLVGTHGNGGRAGTDKLLGIFFGSPDTKWSPKGLH